MEKDYFFINSKKALQEVIPHKKDIYFYGDSHWTPWAAKIIADEITEVINRHKEK